MAFAEEAKDDIQAVHNYLSAPDYYQKAIGNFAINLQSILEKGKETLMLLKEKKKIFKQDMLLVNL